MGMRGAGHGDAILALRFHELPGCQVIQTGVRPNLMVTAQPVLKMTRAPKRLRNHSLERHLSRSRYRSFYGLRSRGAVLPGRFGFDQYRCRMYICRLVICRPSQEQDVGELRAAAATQTGRRAAQADQIIIISTTRCQSA